MRLWSEWKHYKFGDSAVQFIAAVINNPKKYFQIYIFCIDSTDKIR